MTPCSHGRRELYRQVFQSYLDEVIVASSERKDGVGLPTLSYKFGSLENPEIWKAVCNILEGGERAFLDRERRYRHHWDNPKYVSYWS